MAKYWKKNNQVYELHFEMHFEDVVVFELEECKDEENWYGYSSKLLKIEHEEMTKTSLDNAKENIENLFREWLQDNYNYYEQLLEEFDEE